MSKRVSFPRAVFPAVAGIALAAGFLAGRWWPADPPRLEEATALFGEERPLPEFTLTDHNGDEYTRRDIGGGWTLLFFGYTHCPDVCPITLATLTATAETAKEIGTTSPRVVFVSVDPERDSPQHLNGYVSAFGDELLGVTGTHEELQKLAGPLGVFYARAGTGDEYLVDHSAAVLLINPEGELQALFGPPHDPDTIARDFHAIRAYVEG